MKSPKFLELLIRLIFLRMRLEKAALPQQRKMMDDKNTRRFQTSELIRKLCGLLEDEVRVVKREQLCYLEKYLLEANLEPISHELKNYIKTRFRIQDFMRPIIIAESKRILAESEPTLDIPAIDPSKRAGAIFHNTTEGRMYKSNSPIDTSRFFGIENK